MALVIDAVTLTSLGEESVMGSLLSTLLRHPYLDCYVFDDTAPPAPAERGDLVREWLLAPPGGHLDPTLRLAPGPKFHNDRQIDHHRRHPDAKISAAAGAVGADIVVTERELLFEAKLWTWEENCRTATDPQCFRPDQALALIGLYLRAQGHYQIWDELESLDEGVDRQRFYAGGAQALVPAAPQWLAMGEWPGTTGKPWAPVAASVQQRVELLLWQRDLMHQALRSDDFYGIFSAYFAFDQSLILMMGALDAAALSAHQALQLGGDDRSAAWQNKGWVAQLPARHAALAALVAPGTSGRHLLEVLRTLRNTVHKASLSSSAIGELDSHGRLRPLVPLPADPAFMASLAAMGGPDDWGIATGHAGSALTHVYPDVFLERLLVLQTQLLNDLLTQLLREAVAGAARWRPVDFTEHQQSDRARHTLCLLGFNLDRSGFTDQRRERSSVPRQPAAP